MKRSKESLRSNGELKKNIQDRYSTYVKTPSKINPVFTRKPYEEIRKDEANNEYT